MGEDFFFKNYHFTIGFRGRVNFFFSSLPSAAIFCFFFFFFFLVSKSRQQVKFFVFVFVFVFFQQTSMPPSGYQMVRP